MLVFAAKQVSSDKEVFAFGQNKGLPFAHMVHDRRSDSISSFPNSPADGNPGTPETLVLEAALE